jgi:very-short-patch-repair endonuclease
MKSLIWMAVLVVAVFFVLAILKRRQGDAEVPRDVDLRKKRPLTEREQSMFLRLCSTFPEHVVLSQVAFSALLVSKQQATRNGYNRKVADFVLCTKSFDILAVIELDDSSHKGREAADGERDTWLTKVGYRVVRYPQIPDAAKLLADFAPIPLGRGDA